MVFLRKSRAPLPKYVEYLYFVVPLTVCFLHIAPQYIYAGTQGWAISGQDLEPRTPKYMWYVFFVFLFVPYVFVLYNVITSIRVIISLVVKQRAITRVLNLASQETNTLLSGSSSNTVARNSSAAASTVSVTPKERRQLRLARKVYKVSVRIALYPLSPVVTLILLSIFYLQQYFVTLTYKSDVQLFVRLTTMSFFMFPTQAFANFAIFLTDAAVLNVVSEVRRSIRIKMGRKENFQVSDGEMHGPGKTVIRKISAAISESGVSDTMQMESSSFDSFVGEKASIQTDGYFHTPAALEESRPFATAIDGLGDDAVIRRVRASGDAESEYQDLL
ncbi:hypothetical protein H4R26_003928 [Coemansia thaxteri]|uniref:G protein-coupled receptor n=1 Tax=Coemansia thaxteri TaxID=2663907 RepID=A0A9W8BDN7_9FUNG|nr:hypothetical protein H4R26_003928 [Coemansia thaxteri]